MKHTPGPWLVNTVVGQGNPFYRGIVTLLSGDPYTAVIVEDDERAYHTIDHEVMAANARLIAAAPDLLEAAEAAIAFLQADEGGLTESDRQRVLKLLLDAEGKAEVHED